MCSICDEDARAQGGLLYHKRNLRRYDRREIARPTKVPGYESSRAAIPVGHCPVTLSLGRARPEDPT